MNPPPTSDIVYCALFWGADKAVTIGELAESLSLPRRSVEAAVETLRKSGAPICTGRRGVWLTQSGEELLANYRALRRRAVGQLANLRAMQRTARAMAGTRQETLWDIAS
jgi:Mn-dependent DtxR family transcriptional regulator